MHTLPRPEPACPARIAVAPQQQTQCTHKTPVQPNPRRNTTATYARTICNNTHSHGNATEQA
eukprot:1687325-Lingulodinium_polyedra.AAC.1